MNTYTIKPLILSTRKAEMGSMTYLAYSGRPIMRPWLMWYIKAGNKNVLVDSCIDTDDITKHHPGLRIFPQEAVRTFEEALKLVGCSPDDIDIIIQTHLHFDHVYNTGKCKNAEVFVQKKELEFALHPHSIFEICCPTELIRKIDFKIIEGDRTILPGISVIFTPGHSPGGQSVVVETSKGKAVITGFCCIKENFDVPEDARTTISPFISYPVIAPTPHTDLFDSYESVLRVKNIADIIIPSHDPDMAAQREIP